MRTFSVRFDGGSEARLDNPCQTLGLSQSEVVKAGLALLQQQTTSPAALAERMGLVGSFSSNTPESGTSSRGVGHAALLRQKLSHFLFRGATLLDTGPLVAWFDRSDQDHGTCAEFFQRYQGLSCPPGRF